jgi:nucleoside-diphosphate-sugar epimerase
MDVVRAIETLIKQGPGPSRTYNISQDETVPLPDFLTMLADVLGTAPPQIAHVKRSLLESQGFLPDCSPFSDRWMSELTNERSKAELGMVYTPVQEALAAIVAHYESEPPRKPASYSRRSAERNLILQL